MAVCRGRSASQARPPADLVALYRFRLALFLVARGDEPCSDSLSVDAEAQAGLQFVAVELVHDQVVRSLVRELGIAQTVWARWASPIIARAELTSSNAALRVRLDRLRAITVEARVARRRQQEEEATTVYAVPEPDEEEGRRRRAEVGMRANQRPRRAPVPDDDTDHDTDYDYTAGPSERPYTGVGDLSGLEVFTRLAREAAAAAGEGLEVFAHRARETSRQAVERSRLAGRYQAHFLDPTGTAQRYPASEEPVIEEASKIKPRRMRMRKLEKKP